MTLVDQFIVPRLRDYWRRMALHHAHYTDRSDKLDLLYWIEDPWRMESAAEQARFAWTNRLIESRFGQPETILEVGCGEGRQSLHLSEICRRLYGIDVSARAVRRAKRRFPTGQFSGGDPFAFEPPELSARLDLVVACEVLYYVGDIPRFLARLSDLGRACLVTYYQGQAPTLAPYFTGFGDGNRDTLRFGEVEWHAVWWKS